MVTTVDFAPSPDETPFDLQAGGSPVAWLEDAFGSVATPALLPDGAEVVSIEAYLDDTSDSDRKVSSYAVNPPLGFISPASVESDTTRGVYDRSVILDPPRLRDSEIEGLVVSVSSRAWDSALRILGVRITCTRTGLP